MKVLVAGAGGFIGHHLVKRLMSEGFWVRGVDLKRPEFEESPADEFCVADLRESSAAAAAVSGVEHVYQLAADMGGIGYITRHWATIARNNSLINLNMLEAARLKGVGRLLFSSSACVYNLQLQGGSEVHSLREEDAYPAFPEPGYGWEKLYAEQLCRYYRDEFGLDTRIVRFHNCYGPLGTYDGGREKAPSAACRKVALAQDGDEIEIWGDGEQTRSFMFVDDCIEGLLRLMASGYTEPINLGSEELVTINELFAMTMGIAGKRLRIRHDQTKPQGVRGRNSDNNRIREVLSWCPSISLEQGLRATYRWIAAQVASATGTSGGHVPEPVSEEPQRAAKPVAARR